METTFTKFGWKTKSIVRKYYHVKYVGALMSVDSWIDSSSRLFPNDTRRKKCNMCRKSWLDIPPLEKVYVVVFKKEHRNKIVCNECKCKILDTLKIEA